MTVKTVCIEVAHLISHKDEKTSLFSEDQLKSGTKISLTLVFKRKTALKNFPKVTVKTFCIEVAILISHRDQKTSLFSEDKLESVKKILSLPFLNESQHYSFFQWWLWKLFV